jgi:ABC-2 type transport system ATP-binding protein
MADIPYRVRIDVTEPRRLASTLLSDPAVSSVTVAGGAIHVETSDLADLGGRVPRIARDLDLRLTAFEPEDESLESVFRYLVRRR